MALDTFKPYLFVSAGEQSDKYLTPTITNGFGRFQAQRAQELTGLTVLTDPVQSGTGDPSPENVRPISGWTGLSVSVANKNLAPNYAGQSASTGNGITYTYNNDGSVTINGTATANAYSRAVDGLSSNIYLPHGTYKKPVVQIDASHYVGMFVQYVKGESDWTAVTGGALGSTSFTIDEDYPIVIRFAVQNGTTVDNLRFEPYVYPDSVNDLTWVSPVKTNYPITWETEAGTVYGGTLDVVNGVLTVDWGYIASYDGETLPGEWISDRDVYVEGTTPTTEAEVAYKLAEPVTYQLDPEQIMTLPGYNQIYSDAGPVIDIKF